jgi:DNA-binding MarR family transcriptional regulator
MYTLFTIKTLAMEMEEGVKVTDVSTKLAVTPPTASQHIRSLEKQGYIRRCHSTRDRRTVLLSLTDQGRILFRQMENNILKRCIALVKQLGPENTRLLSGLLLQAYEFLKNYNEEEEQTKTC